MRVSKCALAFAAAALLALPVTAAIKALSLSELMEVTHDAVVGTIVARDTVRLDHPWQDALYTRLTIEGESVRTGTPGTWQVVFHGSHEASDEYGISTMPTLQDSRVGGQTLVFTMEHPMLPGQHLVANWGTLYRVEQGFGESVVVGKGEGMAFAENTRLADARTAIRTVHAELQRAPKAPGLSK